MYYEGNSGAYVLCKGVLILSKIYGMGIKYIFISSPKSPCPLHSAEKEFFSNTHAESIRITLPYWYRTKSRIGGGRVHFVPHQQRNKGIAMYRALAAIAFAAIVAFVGGSALDAVIAAMGQRANIAALCCD